MENIKKILHKYITEQKEILKRRPDLAYNGDFTSDGITFFNNERFIKDLKEAITVTPCCTEFCDCGSKLKVIKDELYCPNVDCFKYG